jgi:hypothetical protein
MEIFREVEQDEEVIGRIAAAQREELEQEIEVLQAEAERVAGMVGGVQVGKS